jgi:hypothetical protein
MVRIKTMFLKMQIPILFVALASIANAQNLLLPGTEVLQNYRNGAFEDSIITVHNYTIKESNQCRVDLSEYYTRTINPEVWIKYRKIFWEYNQDDRIAVYKYLNYQKTTRKWLGYPQYYTYNGSFLSTIHSYIKDEDYSCSDTQTANYTYASQGRLTRIQDNRIYCHTGNYHPNGKTEFYYDEQGRHSIDSIFTWSIDFIPNRVQVYSYNSSGQLDSLKLLRSYTSLLSSTLNTHEYFDTGLPLSTTSHVFGEDWLPTIREEYEYDSTQTRRLFTYRKKWNSESNEWYLDSRIKYGTFCTDEVVPEIATEQPLFRLYPNPGEEIRLLALSDIRNLNNIMVHDIRGVVVYNDQFQWPHIDQITERSRSIPAGFYIVTIYSEDYSQQIRWLKSE